MKCDFNFVLKLVYKVPFRHFLITFLALRCYQHIWHMYFVDTKLSYVVFVRTFVNLRNFVALITSRYIEIESVHMWRNISFMGTITGKKVNNKKYEVYAKKGSTKVHFDQSQISCWPFWKTLSGDPPPSDPLSCSSSEPPGDLPWWPHLVNKCSLSYFGRKIFLPHLFRQTKSTSLSLPFQKSLKTC